MQQDGNRFRPHSSKAGNPESFGAFRESRQTGDGPLDNWSGFLRPRQTFPPLGAICCRSAGALRCFSNFTAQTFQYIHDRPEADCFVADQRPAPSTLKE